MKYLTKEWYQLMNESCADSSLGMRKIPDKEYTEDDINLLYEKELKARLRMDRREYNRQPSIEFELELLDDPGTVLDDWLWIDDDTQQCSHPESKEEVRKYIEEKYEKAMEDFLIRPPFDPELSVAAFEDELRNNLEFAKENFPEWVSESVDSRLLALNYLPKKILIQLRQERREKEKEFKKIDRRVTKALQKEAEIVPQKIKEIFNLHDTCVLGFKKEGRAYSMTLRLDGDCFLEGTTPFAKIIFSEATLIEREKGIVIRAAYEENNCYRSNCHVLFNEIYRKSDGGYEVHFMLWASGLKYLTLSCQDIKFESNLDLESEKPIDGKQSPTIRREASSIGIIGFRL